MFINESSQCLLNDFEHPFNRCTSFHDQNETSCIERIHPLEVFHMVLGSRNSPFLLYIQPPGEILCFPENWLHGTINLEPQHSFAWVGSWSRSPEAHVHQISQLCQSQEQLYSWVLFCAATIFLCVASCRRICFSHQLYLRSKRHLA